VFFVTINLPMVGTPPAAGQSFCEFCAFLRPINISESGSLAEFALPQRLLSNVWNPNMYAFEQTSLLLQKHISCTLSAIAQKNITTPIITLGKNND
jgi:hypothetical protein